MSSKISVQDYMVELLNNYGCKGIVIHNDHITSQCPHHFNKKNFQTFHLATTESDYKGVQGYYYHCFSCGAGGSIVKLIAHLLGCSYKKASRIFSKRVLVDGVTMDKISREFEALKSDAITGHMEECDMPEESRIQDPMWKYMESRSRTYHDLLDVEYVVNKYGLYYCSTDRMAGRIIMPVRHIDGTVVGYNDRTIDDDIKNKSLHVRDMPYGNMIHGLYESLGRKKVVVCEGSFDMFAVDCALKLSKDHRRAFGQVNIMGTAFTDERVRLLVENFDEIYLMLDNDKAGIDMAKKLFFKYSEDIALFNCTESYPKDKDPGICTAKEIIHALAHPKREKKSNYLDYIVNKYDFKV